MATSSFRVDTSEMRRLARDLEQTVPGTKKAIGEAIEKGAHVTAIEARALSSWSSRIPGTVRVVGGLSRAVVRAGGANAPHAAPFEHGGIPGTFRHPVFGNRNNWVTQQARPFLRPAIELTAPGVELILRRNVDAVWAAAGFH